MQSSILQESAYQAHFALVQHYSSLIFKARMSIITVILIIWAYILGIGQDVGDYTFQIGEYTLSAKAGIAYITSITITIFITMEISCVKRYFHILSSAQAIEAQYQKPGYFSNYPKTLTTTPFYLFYVFNFLALIAVFTSITLLNNGVLWHTVLFVLLPLLVPFVLLIWIIRELSGIIRRKN